MSNENVSLLDYFAGKVIEGCCYNMNLTIEKKAKLAFDLAEQMVKEKASRELLAKATLVTGPDQYCTGSQEVSDQFDSIWESRLDR